MVLKSGKISKSLKPNNIKTIQKLIPREIEVYFKQYQIANLVLGRNAQPSSKYTELHLKSDKHYKIKASSFHFSSERM